MVEVNLAELPLEILEQIVANLEPDEVVTSVSQISRRFAEVSYNVLCQKFRELQAPIQSRLTKVKENLEQLCGQGKTVVFEEGMVQVSNFTLYQILYSEYKILCTIYFNRKSVEHSALVFHGVRSLKEFNKLLVNRPESDFHFHDENVSSLLEGLRTCNSELIEFFFCKVWDVDKDPMGTLFLNLLNCSLCSSYDLEVTHEQNPRAKNAKCHISGNFAIADLSNTLSSPPDGLKDSTTEKAKKIFLSYVCSTVRWGNLFHTLRLRWICLDTTLALERAQRQRIPGGPQIDTAGLAPRLAYGWLNPYGSTMDDTLTVEESVQAVHNGNLKTVRRLKKTSSLPPDTASWMGTRIEMQLWCRSDGIPDEMLAEDYRVALQNLTENTEGDEGSSTWPYHFKLKYNANVRALSNGTTGLIRTTVTVKDTPENTSIQQIKTIITS